MKDNMSKTIKNASRNTTDLKNKTKTAEREVKKFGNSAKKSYARATNGIKGMAMAGIGLVTAYAGLSFLKSTTEFAKKQTIAEAKLAAVLKNVTGVTDEQVTSLKNHSSALQKVGVIGDEVTLSGMAQLGTFQLQASSIETLSGGMLDLLANQKGLNATQEDAQSVGNLLGKVMNGQTGALSKMGISFTDAQAKILKYGTEQERAAALAQVLEDNVGGVNKALAQTDDGKIQQATNNWGDFKEVVGVGVTKALGNFAGWFNTKIPTIQEQFLKMKDNALLVYDVLKNKWAEIKPTVDKIKYTVIELKDKALAFYNVLKDNWSTIVPIVLVITSAFLIYKGVMTALEIKTLAYAVASIIKNRVMAAGATTVNAVTIAQWALNAAMNANPVGVVIAAITALVVVGILLYKNFDKIKEAAARVWQSTQGLRDSFGSFASSIWDTIKPVREMFNWLDKVFGISEKVGKAVSKVKDWWNGDNKNKPETKVVSNINNMNRYAKGGIASKPSIFGDGPEDEIAIPLNKSKRSKNLLSKATEIIGSETVNVNASSKGAKSSPNVNIRINVKGNLIGNKAFIDEVGSEITTKVKLALANM